jgi:hypothetical protein
MNKNRLEFNRQVHVIYHGGVLLTKTVGPESNERNNHIGKVFRHNSGARRV